MSMNRPSPPITRWRMAKTIMMAGRARFMETSCFGDVNWIEGYFTNLLGKLA
jgi:hypothetical protein